MLNAAFSVIVQQAVYTYMRRLCEAYQGAYWNFFELSNGGFYMAPELKGLLHIRWPSNYFEGQASADAAGIIACSFAYNHLFSCYHRELVNEPVTAKLDEKLEQLMAYVKQHPEADLIYAAVD